MLSRPTRRTDSLSGRVDPLADGIDGLLIGSDRGASAFPRPSAAVHPNLLRNVVSAPLGMRYTASPAGKYSYFVRLRQVVAVLALRPIMYFKGNCKH